MEGRDANEPLELGDLQDGNRQQRFTQHWEDAVTL